MIAAVLSGTPNYWVPNHDESTIEVFNHIGEVIEAMFDRYSANGERPCDVVTLDGKITKTVFPTFGEGCQLTCFEVSDPAPANRETLVMEVLTAVHGGHWDWDVELIATDSDLMTVNVEKAGVS